MNLVSYHLKQLRNHRVVTERRSSADGRDVYYSVDLPRLNELYQEGGSQLHPAIGNAIGNPITSQPAIAIATTSIPLRVLFLCTHNRARSQMAEGLLRAVGGSAVEVFSAGSEPSVVHPYAIRALADVGIDIRPQRSKHLDEFNGQSFDLIITVCDRVREQCPVFPGDPARIHWSIGDPIRVDQPDDYTLFAAVAREIRTRITYLLLAHQQRMKNAHAKQILYTDFKDKHG
jgi:ArsR family transcriptional regulator, arsenate/arsenite/antimonite-responsive transcriptional repressor / arsenate reductase (thioredoxin)